MNMASRLGLPTLLLALCSPAWSQAPVTDIGTSQRRAGNSGSEAVESGYPASTYPSDVSAIERPSEPVVERETPAGSPPSIERPTESRPAFRQSQALEEEVAALRGEVEELRHAVRQLQQQQSAQAATPASAATSGTAASVATPAQPAASNNMTSEGKAEYEAAYSKLKSKDYDGAISGFKSVASQYPNSEYAGSSHFWLGFVYQTKGDTENATQSFSTMIERFPNHSKAPDAKYNLGKLYHQQGNTEKAKTLLKDVAAGTSRSAPLAKSYLESM